MFLGRDIERFGIPFGKGIEEERRPFDELLSGNDCSVNNLTKSEIREILAKDMFVRLDFLESGQPVCLQQ